MGHNWQTGETITAALLNGVAQVGDIGTPGTPTGDALKAAYVALPAGGSDGQALVKSGTSVVWGAGGGGGGGGGATLTVAATATTAGTLTAAKHTPVDATAAALTMALPTGAAAGTLLSTEKLDASVNAVTITGNIRGTPASNVALVWKNEALLLVADAAGAWWPIAGHKTKAALDAAYVGVGSAAPVVSNSVCALGDSLTNMSGGPGVYSAGARTESRGMHAWANVLLKHGMDIWNAGKVSDTTAQMLARWDTDVLKTARILTVLGGTNDMLGNIAATTSIANLTAIYQKARALGMLVVACTVPPNVTATTAQLNEALKVNRFIRDYCRANNGMVLADVGAAIADPATTWRPLTGTIVPDGTHPSALGGALMGRVLADALDAYLPGNDLFGQCNGDPTNLLSNPLLYTTGTALPTGWTFSGGALPGGITPSYVAASDGLAAGWYQLVVPNGTTTTLNLQQNVTVDGTNLSVGDSPYFAIEVEVDNLDPAPPTTSQSVRAVLQAYNGTTFTSKQYDLYWDTTTNYQNVPFPGSSGGLVTQPVTVPTGTTLMQVLVQIVGGGTYRFRRAALRK